MGIQKKTWKLDEPGESDSFIWLTLQKYLPSTSRKSKTPHKNLRIIMAMPRGHKNKF